MDIMEKVQEIFRDILDLEDLILDGKTSANDLEEWDSLAHINIIIAIELEFKTKFALGEIQELKNVEDMIELIKSKIS
tara:strand:+ start:344 stop:577 length:234 start_codon:yes stop_codon:yes gene_type:complete